MTPKKRDFYGKEVTDAIKKACKELRVPQEQLEIEVIETGSTGIFGLIRKKAHIVANIKEAEPSQKKKGSLTAEKTKSRKTTTKEEVEPASEPASEPVADPPVEAAESLDNDTLPEKIEQTEELAEDLSQESLELIKEELQQLLNLMGFPSAVELQVDGTSITCKVGDEFEEAITGQEGKTLDSIQYLLRKIIARKIPNRLRLTVDVGNYREKRLSDLKIKAVELAELVKADGKTQVISALSPSERRVVHMSLQDDKDIRSRSVGDGLFKKILIYKAGKGNKNGGRRRNSSRGRRGGSQRKKDE